MNVDFAGFYRSNVDGTSRRGERDRQCQLRDLQYSRVRDPREIATNINKYGNGYTGEILQNDKVRIILSEFFEQMSCFAFGPYLQ